VASTAGPAAVNGEVHVVVELKGAPAGTTARATTTGAARVSPPRIETAMPALG